MRVTTIILSILLIMVISLCIIFLYLWIDRAVTLAYVNASLASEVRVRVIITGLIESEWNGKGEDEVYKKLMVEVNRHPEQVIILKNDNEDEIEFNNLLFRFVDGKLNKIE